MVLNSSTEWYMNQILRKMRQPLPLAHFKMWDYLLILK
ncbi:hypothetical protein A2U01_0112479, partial [Trifolium medium]|nr:hypothetical protein [Trifolium medium]